MKANSIQKCIPWFISTVKSLQDAVNQWDNIYDCRPPLKQWPACRRGGKERSKVCQRKGIVLLYKYYMDNNHQSLWEKRYTDKGYSELRTLYTKDPFYQIIKKSKSNSIRCNLCNK